MTHPMIERVARALCKKKLGHGLIVEPAPHYVDKYWHNFTDLARLAIEAMREPSEDMIERGWTDGDDDIPDVWRVMIDSILEFPDDEEKPYQS